jgi:hypothetical protein
MGRGPIRERGARAPLVALLAALVAAAVLLLPSGSALAGPVSKDGQVHACYKVKGKGKGAMRVARNAKGKCPKGWKKLAWSLAGQAGSPGANGESGAPGSNGAAGDNGANGAAASQKSVTELEKQVTDLLGKLQSLETILSGVTNGQLKEAIGAVPVVGQLCAQAKSLNEQTSSLGSAASGLNTVLAVALPLLNLPDIPVALPAFACPAT